MPDVLLNAFSWLGMLPRRALIAGVQQYQRWVSPWLPAVFGPTYGCRFHPTCSQYAVEALRVRGFGVGLLLIVARLLRCNPLHPGGDDPVPNGTAASPLNVQTGARRRGRPQCRRAAGQAFSH